MGARGETGLFAGFQYNFASEMVPALIKPKPGKGLLKLSKSRIETAAKHFLAGTTPNPENDFLPTSVSATVGIVAHTIIQATDIWRTIRPRDGRDYEMTYLHNVTTQAPSLMPNIPPDAARRLLAALAAPGCAMPYTSTEFHRPARRQVYDLIASNILNQFKQQPPFVTNLRLDGQVRSFADCWTQDQADLRLSTVVDNIFAYHENHPVLDGHGRNILVTASELRVSTFIKELGIFSARLDRVRFGQQSSGPPKIITIDDWKTSVNPPESLLELPSSMCDHVIGQIVASLSRIPPPTQRKAIEVKDALILYHPKTAVVAKLHGFGTNPPWEQTSGSPDHPLAASPTEVHEKKNAFVQMINTILLERPDLLPLFQ